MLAQANRSTHHFVHKQKSQARNVEGHGFVSCQNPFLLHPYCYQQRVQALPLKFGAQNQAATTNHPSTSWNV